MLATPPPTPREGGKESWHTPGVPVGEGAIRKPTMLTRAKSKAGGAPKAPIAVVKKTRRGRKKEAPLINLTEGESAAEVGEPVNENRVPTSAEEPAPSVTDSDGPRSPPTRGAKTSIFRGGRYRRDSQADKPRFPSVEGDLERTVEQIYASRADSHGPRVTWEHGRDRAHDYSSEREGIRVRDDSRGSNECERARIRATHEGREGNRPLARNYDAMSSEEKTRNRDRIETRGRQEDYRGRRDDLSPPREGRDGEQGTRERRDGRDDSKDRECDSLRFGNARRLSQPKSREPRREGNREIQRRHDASVESVNRRIPEQCTCNRYRRAGDRISLSDRDNSGGRYAKDILCSDQDDRERLRTRSRTGFSEQSSPRELGDNE